MFKKILIADDHYVVRAGTGFALQRYNNEIEIHFAESYFEIEYNLKNDDRFDLLILDINMPGVDKSVIKKIKSLIPEIKIMLFSSYTGGIVLQFLREGADGYVNKLSSSQEIVDSITKLFRDEIYLPPSMTREIINLEDFIDPKKYLSAREFEVFELLTSGLGNLEITNKLLIKPATVSTLKNRILKKLNVNSVAELVKIKMNFKNLHN